MTKRNIIILSGIVLIALAFFAVRIKNKAPEKSSTTMIAIAVEPFEINGGWGYKVNMDGHTYIYQDVIPGVPGNRVFQSKENALRVGNAVMDKLTHHKIPAISQQELINMQIGEAR
ncbi:uncharacterized protein DUF4907 [Chitinophaga niastensis]|uniref:Uncharacterized protein DUF4907 n=1 Tax=Chitinophaga niastensis TaxID=536980 RepID=A0A2P8HN01_CHINA|nr:DUF4907 domain-containing protein [Chitinophaga niastensis]PSL47584.1 uncharacterized protein DUF4907 [Chitinophaga niastensis]